MSKVNQNAEGLKISPLIFTDGIGHLISKASFADQCDPHDCQYTVLYQVNHTKSGMRQRGISVAKK